jgi:hypothetical protein
LNDLRVEQLDRCGLHRTECVAERSLAVVCSCEAVKHGAVGVSNSQTPHEVSVYLTSCIAE